jgi:hypothetical protein
LRFNAAELVIGQQILEACFGIESARGSNVQLRTRAGRCRNRRRRCLLGPNGLHRNSKRKRGNGASETPQGQLPAADRARRTPAKLRYHFGCLAHVQVRR